MRTRKTVHAYAWTTALLTVCTGATADVSYQRIVNAASEPHAWLTHSGTYRSERYSSLDQIDTENVSQLKVIWAYQMTAAASGGAGLVETTPLVADGVMYITEPPSTVTALDARTGKKLWSYTPAMSEDVKHIGFPQVNRGVALLGDTVYVGTLDAHLIALDAATGAVRWRTQVGANRTGFSLTLAPLAVKDKIIIGVSGAEAGVRGFLDAYDARSGVRSWRFHTVPAPGEAGSDTWGGESWRTGGGSTWLTGSFDPQLNLLYWTVGNPAPDWNGDLRPGDNLYTCSLLALDPDTGKLQWHFQFTPHDTHDWDANQIPVLFDWGGRKLVALANRNAFYYVLDRTNGEFVTGQAYSKQTWAHGLDASGRPIVRPDTEPTYEGNLIWPSLQGATNWFSPSLDPRNGRFFVAVRLMGSTYYKADVEYEEGQPFYGGGEQAHAGDDAAGAIRALDVTTGDRLWEFPLLSPPWAGVMASAGGLVFGGSNEGNVFALDALTGKSLWHFQTGGAVRTNPMGYAIDGNQRIVTTGGRTLYVFGLR
ncbi:MAG: PQQ-dependent dehydrogenase, methanol/ethanol family [Pseudomonadales bacterium]|jgi:alcohol dehydrogenase (cytochrome c)|nr:PQQ-dependent dehydrogenase, methanol/ethanol family [Pseudomonadales bacterium]MDP6470483.1 PQQ-dependent dehydrogenase, methanol/ethanol family [Pseudomonadales bacterium]MDP6827785.1 PQQ-dependent dehydrogenase, methanol/ethanol family [Pseudomonadales bacterium]MDP6970742.1 PQQ-dependent dehydrogenase, methanol/ethanol family [Pseudomonadales bacterium]|tara:strand:+ start:1222 stop:2832 length:1611 start_codon:yes stop_codon:yes gene_type:complete